MRIRLLILAFLSGAVLISCSGSGEIDAADIIACGAFKAESHFCDRRDGTVYKHVRMPDGKTWMAENLNYNADGSSSRCYDNKQENCEKYGRLYSWLERASLCPDGWKIPNMAADWEMLEREVGAQILDERLKAVEGWNAYGSNKNGNGTDDYGFAALPAGTCVPDSSNNCSKFEKLGEIAVFMGESDGSAWLITNDPDMDYDIHPRMLMSVRCVKE